MTDETGANEADNGTDETETITVPVEIPVDDEVHGAAWGGVEAAATSPEAAREQVGDALAESVPTLELQSLIYEEFRRVKHEEEQATGMLDELAEQATAEREGRRGQ